MSPFAIPSRMTVNQLLQTAIGKKICMDGEFIDGTPFTSNSTDRAQKLYDEMGKCLVKYGFAPSGNETMYNGMTGKMMNAKIFIGPTYYQRLKHMVSDK